ncbi:PREDICTED: uncharacterized protein LOC108557466 [Nicrophorus vespilloides]|uniref:Uncharacterized protein LOC108557466 n=1 Tax=Nicrophorus vespilloides TaxID=110193 RepID=A0ABM1M4G1_NICVS|nr:PREDICTED: uncharacterized protein LOC108557466 [Nicrophorus vespilloides]
MKQLAVEVSELHVGDNGELWITCMSTIPGYVGYNENYADVRKHSRQIEVLMTEVPAEIISNTNEIVDSSSSSSSNNSNNNAATLKDTDILESIYPFFIAALIVFLF